LWTSMGTRFVQFVALGLTSYSHTYWWSWVSMNNEARERHF
jgi:hypothetical protein